MKKRGQFFLNLYKFFLNLNLIQDINIMLYKCFLEFSLTAANKRDQEFQ